MSDISPPKEKRKKSKKNATLEPVPGAEAAVKVKKVKKVKESGVESTEKKARKKRSRESDAANPADDAPKKVGSLFFRSLTRLMQAKALFGNNTANVFRHIATSAYWNLSILLPNQCRIKLTASFSVKCCSDSPAKIMPQKGIAC